MDIIKNQILLIFTTPLYLIIIGLEIVISHFQGLRAYSVKDTAYNFYLSILTGLAGLMMRGVSLWLLSLVYQRAAFEWAPTWWYWLILLLLVDFMHYWLHRISHFCRFFWAVHVNHHSSQHFNFSVGFRSAVLEPFYGFIFLIPVAACGFQPAHIFFIYAITEIWAVLTHTKHIKTMGWVDHILVTPSHHRVHHASNARYLDRNMGTLFIIWDRLFGTFQKELPANDYEPIRYGLTHPIASENLSTVIFHEWDAIRTDVKRKDITWKEKWRYIFGTPGWSHDGSRLTSRILRQQELEQSSKTAEKEHAECSFNG